LAGVAGLSAPRLCRFAGHLHRLARRFQTAWLARLAAAHCAIV